MRSAPEQPLWKCEHCAGWNYAANQTCSYCKAAKPHQPHNAEKSNKREHVRK